MTGHPSSDAVVHAPSRAARPCRRARPGGLLFAALLQCCAQAPSVVSGVAGALPPVDSVFASYYRAIGGLNQLQAVSTRRMWGTYTEGSFIARTDIAWRRPGTRRVNVHAPGFDYSEGYDGRTWEYSSQSRRLVVDTGAAADAGRRGAESDEAFVDYVQKGHRVALLGADSVAGRPVYRVRVSLADGWEKEYLFDQRTGLIVAVRKAMPIHARGPAIASLTSYEDWRLCGGLLQPHRFIEREVGTGRLLNTLQWDSVRLNVLLAPQELGRPAIP